MKHKQQQLLFTDGYKIVAHKPEFQSIKKGDVSNN